MPELTETLPLPEGELQIAMFNNKSIRRVVHNNEWYFSVVDVIDALAETTNPRRYWSDLKRTLIQEGAELYDEIVQLKMPAPDGKDRETDAASTETMFRIIQSVPSPKAEPFKKWLARTGYERLLETQNPDIAIKRAIMDYRLMGYPDEWIEARIKTIQTRNELTAEWDERGIEGREFAILSNAISEETFDVGVQEHKALKNLGRNNNLRDHMTPLELVFTMLGEKSTTEITRARDAQGFYQAMDAAHDGGKVAGDARKQLEEQLGAKIVTSDNYLKGPKKSPRLPEAH